MEKILLAIDAINPDLKALEFACYLGRLTKSKITGIFLENLVDEERLVLKQSRGMAYMEPELDVTSEEYKSKVELINKTISWFKEACIQREVNYKIHRDRGVPASELINESRYADVLVMDAETSFHKRYEGAPTYFVRNILKKAECPVIIAPERFEGIGEIIFTYNGSPSSVFAIKQFTYLFPQLRDKKLNLIKVIEAGEFHDPDKYKLKEWLQEHYTDLHFETLQGDTDEKLFDYLFNRRNLFLIIGAYSKDTLLRFFRHSHADFLIKTITQAIFIAHI